MKTKEVKMLPFKTKDGEAVPAHALAVAIIPWFEGKELAVSRVVFSTFNRDLGVPVEASVHVSDLTRYLKNDPCGGLNASAVILSNGHKMYAKAYSVRHYDTKAYCAAPILCRDVFAIRTLSGGDTLVEIVGVADWARSERRPEGAALILDPFARDNAMSRSRFSEIPLARPD